MIDKRIIEFITHHHVLTLATGHQELLHCCNLFYAYLGEQNWFAVTSSPETLHVQQVSEHPQIAASIVLETSVLGKLQGVQLRGTMLRPTETEQQTVRYGYLKRFPFSVVMDLDLWIIRPSYLKYTDNRLGFGKKIIWETENQPTI